MVEGYSRRSLSVSSDKFPAISGLATEYSYLLGDSYIAGLWRSDIIRGLCWRSSQQSPQNSSIDYAPSWSWAKTNEPILYDLLHDKNRKPSPPDGKKENFQSQIMTIDLPPFNRGKKITPVLPNNNPTLPLIFDVQIVPQGEDPNGTLSSAIIYTRAHVAKLDFISKDVSFLESERLTVHWDVVPDKTWSYRVLYLASAKGVSWRRWVWLILVPHARKKNHFVRVGIAEAPRDPRPAIPQVENIYLIWRPKSRDTEASEQYVHMSYVLCKTL